MRRHSEPRFRSPDQSRRIAPYRQATLGALTCGALALLAGCSDRSIDNPAGGFRVRGTIEGFYGQPYTTDERARLLRFSGERGMNVYVYAPKSDPKHRDQWREPYTADELAAFGELAAIGNDSGVRLTFAISPGITIDPSDPAEFSRLEAKLRSVHDVGVRGFALLFDDIFAHAPAIQPQVQAQLIARTADLVRSFADGSDFWFIGNLYAGTADAYRNATIDPHVFTYTGSPIDYFDAYAALVSSDIPILWTGPQVISAALHTDVARAFRTLAARPVIVWDNYPANDIFTTDLFLGPYLGRDSDLDGAVDGIVCNLMVQPTAGLLPIATAADYMRDPRAYDAERSWSDAIDALGGSGADALRLFAAQHRGHPFLEGAVEAPELGERVASAFSAGAGAADRASLRALLAAFGDLESRLAALPDAALRSEIEPWAAKLAKLGRAGLLGLDALDGLASAADYRAARDAALALPQFVAKDDAAPAIAAINGTPAHHTDRFADLFAAIDARL